MSLEHGIVALLLDDADTVALVGSNITAGQIGNPDLSYPHIIIELQAVDYKHTTDQKATTENSLVTVYCVAQTQNEAISIADAVNAALDGYNGGGSLVEVSGADDVDIASIRRRNMQNSPAQIGTREYRRAVSFSVWSRGT